MIVSVRILLLGLLCLPASCGGRSAVSFPGDGGTDPNRVIARYNGKPVTWIEVARKTMELSGRRAVDQYVFWRAIEDRKESLEIRNTSEELRLRALAAVERMREEEGVEGLAARLEAERTTAEEYARRLARSENLDDTLALEKLAAYETLRRGAIRLDWILFSDEEDAKVFAEYAALEADFDNAYGRFLQTNMKGQHRRGNTGFFPRAFPPERFDRWIIDKAFELEKGASTGVEYSQAGGYYVIRLQDRTGKREGSYADLAQEVLEHVLREPTSQDLLRQCAAACFRECRIEYGESTGNAD